VTKPTYEELEAENRQLKFDLARAKEEIKRLKDDNSKMDWQLNPDRMGS
jgi:hypothetical protein